MKSKEIPGPSPEPKEPLSPEEEAMLRAFTEFAGIEKDLGAAPGDRKELDDEANAALARQWYFDTSHAGHTREEYEALKQETSKSLTLDFQRYATDADYRDLMQRRNPFLERILDDEWQSSRQSFLEDIQEAKAKLGISDEQFRKILALCEPEVRKRFAENAQVSALLTSTFKKLGPETNTKIDNAVNRKMQSEIEKRERGE